jgi:hypothetical protein
MGAHQSTPGTLVRPVDAQQALCDGDHGIGTGLLAQQGFRDRAGAVAQALTFCRQPLVERRVDAVELVEQFAVEQGKRRGIGRGGSQHLDDIDPDGFRADRQMVAGDAHDLGPGGL